MKLYIFLFLFSLCCTSSLNSQVRGCVVDGRDKSPLSGVNIYLQRDSTGIAITDDSGKFKLGDWNQGILNDTLVFSYVGYMPMKYTLKELEASGYIVKLYSYSQSLQEVVVKGESRRTFGEYEFLNNICRKGFILLPYLRVMEKFMLFRERNLMLYAVRV